MPPWLYPAALAIWLVVFGAETFGIARWTASLWHATERMERDALRLSDKAREAVSVGREAAALSEEMAFLQSLPSLLPQDKGYLRTQKAIGDDVQRLRLKVSHRLKNSLHIVVDAKANKLYLKKGLKLLWQADCSVGKGGVLRDRKSGRIWEFATPRGELEVLGKRENPFWIMPDWAFVELGQEIPPPDDQKRRVEGVLGAYLLNLGDGYLIHGTKDEANLGRAISHGCVRLGAKDLENLYKTVPVGTKVYIIY